jgi:hypothetical protein
MSKRQTKKMQRYAKSGMPLVYGAVSYPEIYTIPTHLKEEYRTQYQIKLSYQEYRDLVKTEIEALRIKPNGIQTDYKLWFGKYKGEAIHQMSDEWYLTYLCEVYRNKNTKLVGQALLRLDELRDNPPEV